MDKLAATPDARKEVGGDEGGFFTPQNDDPAEETTLTNKSTTTRSASAKKISKPAQLLGSVLRSNSKDADTESTRTSKVSNANTTKEKKFLISLRQSADKKVVGLKRNALDKSTYEKRHRMMVGSNHSRRSGNSQQRDKGGAGTSSSKKFSVEEKEEEARAKAMHNPFLLLYLGNLAAVKVMLYYLITLETMISCGLTAGLTIYWYVSYDEDSDWNGGGMDFVLLAFALTAPISAAMTMAFNRRERALITIADFRSWSYHLYLAHSLWDWPDKGGRAGANVDWVEHCDAVMAQLVGIGDELSRFLSLPTTSRSRHRMTKQGRREAARTIEVAYQLLESTATQRLTRLVMYSERIKKIGLPSGELSRIRQYERFLSSMVEQLRMIKMYRTPQAFRSFARIFTLALPPFYAPTFAQVAIDVNSPGVGIAFGIITALGLTALFESLQIMEDPFVAFLALDGIDVKEEFEVLHFAQLLNTRKLVFPDAPIYPAGRRAALTSKSTKPSTGLGMPPMQFHHVSQRHIKTVSNLPDLTEEDLQAESDQYAAMEVHDDGESTLSHIDEDNEAEEELGPRLDEDDDSFVRLTDYFDDEVEGRARTGSMGGSQHSLRSRRHVRQWSRG